MQIRHLIVAAGLAAGSVASGQTASQTFNLGNFTTAGGFVTPSIDTTGVTGDFVAWRVTTDWSVAGGDPFSSEASVAFGDLFDLTLRSNFEAAVNSQPDGLPVAGLTFAGGFIADPLDAVDLVIQLDAGIFGDANFNNTQIEWFTAADIPVTSTSTFGSGPASANAPTNFIDLGVLGNVGDTLSFDLFGSTGDTEMAIYDAQGNLVAENDDAGGTLQSAIAFDTSGGTEIVVNPDGTIEATSVEFAPGDYFIAVDEFDTLFGADFDILPGTEAGDILDIVLNLDGSELSTFQVTDAGPTFLKFTIVPAPGAAALLGMGGLLAARRRRG